MGTGERFLLPSLGAGSGNETTGTLCLPGSVYPSWAEPNFPCEGQGGTGNRKLEKKKWEMMKYGNGHH